MERKVVPLVEIVLNETGDLVFKNNGHLAEAKPLGKPFILECNGMEDPFDEVRKNLDSYLSDIQLPEDLTTLGVLTGEETKIYAYGSHHFYPVQLYRVIED